MAMKKQKVVIGGSTVTVGQLKDFFRMIDDGTIGYSDVCKFLEMEPEPEPSISVSARQLDNLAQNIKDGMIGFGEMKKFLENPQRGILPRKITHVRAANILGAEKMVYLQESHRFWKVYYDAEEYDRLSGYVRYSEKTLREAAQQNKQCTANWYLIYIIGLTLPEQVTKIGTSSKRQPCFYLDDFILSEQEKVWTEKKTTNGDYYLINFGGNGTSELDRPAQLKKIEELGPGYEVVDPHMFAEAVISIDKKHKVRIPDIWYHRSLVRNFEDNRDIVVGEFNELGLKVQTIPSSWGESCRMITYKKHDF